MSDAALAALAAVREADTDDLEEETEAASKDEYVDREDWSEWRALRLDD